VRFCDRRVEVSLALREAVRGSTPLGRANLLNNITFKMTAVKGVSNHPAITRG
jgi:hypothetical protein